MPGATPHRGAPKSGLVAQSREWARDCGVTGIQEAESAEASGAPGLRPEDEVPQRSARTRCIARPRFDVGLRELDIGGAARVQSPTGARTATLPSGMRCRIEVHDRKRHTPVEP